MNQTDVPEIEVLGVTISYPDWHRLDHLPDPKRYEHADITIQVKGTRWNLYSILGLSELMDERGRFAPHFGPTRHEVIISEFSPDQLLPDRSMTLLKRLNERGYLSLGQYDEILKMAKSVGSGNDRCAAQD